MITIKNISKAAGDNFLFSRLSLHVDSSEFVIITDPNYYIVSSVLKCICGISKVDAGTIEVNNYLVSELKGNALRKYRQSISYISSLEQINSRDTVFQNVSLPLICNTLSKELIQLKIHTALSFLGIEDYIQSKVGKLSDILKIKVMICRAIAQEVNVLVIDDIFSSLLDNEKTSIIECLKQISQKLHITVILGTSHLNYELLGDCKLLNLEYSQDDGTNDKPKIEDKNDNQALPISVTIENYLSKNNPDYQNSESLVYQIGCILKIPFTIIFGKVYSENGDIKEQLELQIEQKFLNELTNYLKLKNISFKNQNGSNGLQYCAKCKKKSFFQHKTKHLFEEISA